MSKRKEPSNNKTARKGGNLIPALCAILGTLIILFVIAVAAPLTVPRLLGYEIYNVVSGSMEPEIPVGSAVYVKSVSPTELQPGEIIAFRDEGSTVTHRVVENHVFAGEVITKGDANEIEDFEPVVYPDIIGLVEHHIPVVGNFMMLLSGTMGKVYLLCLALCGAMFNILGARLRENNLYRQMAVDEELLLQLSALEEEGSIRKPTKKRKKSRGGRIFRNVVMGLMLAVFAVSGATVLFVRHQYKVSETLYEEAASTFTAESKPLSIELPAYQAQKKFRLPEIAPIEVDFAALQKINPDITAWIYCPDTVINYPVLHGESNDDYLHHSYDRSYNAAGSIFVEETNARDLSDCNYILYGHHMGDKSMFATLDRWQDQGYFDGHPYMWLLTPEQDYKIFLYSAYTISAYDRVYSVYHARDAEFESWLKKSGADSVVAADVELDPDAKYVMLSTCAYIFEDARSVLHGQLQPISSAGGLPIPGLETQASDDGGDA